MANTGGFHVHFGPKKGSAACACLMNELTTTLCMRLCMCACVAAVVLHMSLCLHYLMPHLLSALRTRIMH